MDYLMMGRSNKCPIITLKKADAAFKCGIVTPSTRGGAIRQNLTDECHERGKHERAGFQHPDRRNCQGDIRHHSIGTQGVERAFKKERLRDHMTDLELIFTKLVKE